MAAPMTRVARGDRQQHVEFTLPAEKPLGYDEAMVGGADEQATSITIDPSERDNNPYLGGGEDEPDTWDLPEGTQQPSEPPRRREQEPPQQREQGDPESDEDVRLAYDEDEPMGRQERQGRRSRRNRNTRQAIDQRDQMIAGLNERISKQEEMLSRVMGGQFQLSARDIDQRIRFHGAALERANVEMARAIKEADGEAFAAIQTERDKIYRELYGLQSAKQNLEQAAERTFAKGGPVGEGGEEVPPQQRLTPEQQRAIQDQESEYERMRDIFLDRYTWFDPDNGDDEDHDFVLNLDAKLAREGYNRGTQAFWHQMERRMQAAGFRPDGGGGQQQQRQQEERPMQPTRRVNGNGFDNGGGTQRRFGGPPTGAVRSGRRPGGGGAVPLTEQEQDMLRDEGLLEPNLSEQDLAKRDRIIDKWQRGKQALQRGGRR